MINIFTGLFKWLSGGVIQKGFDTIDKFIESETDKERLKKELLQTHIRTRAEVMRTRAFWLVFAAGLPFIYHAGWVAIYSVHFHQNGMWPKDWDIAALPSTYLDYQWLAIATWLGVLGVLGWRWK